MQRKTQDGHTVTYLNSGEIPLYYTDGMLILENGTAYDIGNSCPDYASLLGKLLPLYHDLEITGDGGTYSVTASGETA